MGKAWPLADWLERNCGIVECEEEMGLALPVDESGLDSSVTVGRLLWNLLQEANFCSISNASLAVGRFAGSL